MTDGGGLRKRRSPGRLRPKLRVARKTAGISIAPGLELVGVGKRPDGSFSAVLDAKTLDGTATVILPFELLTTPSAIAKTLVRVGRVRHVKSEVNSIIATLLGDRKLPSIAFVDSSG